jgi:threonyl-tRNA synthetase
MANRKLEGYEASQLFRVRHSTAHVMAQAVLEIFPGAKIAIGPAIEDGFYYDFDLPRTLTPEDLNQIENRMRLIIKGDHKFEYKVVSTDEARQRFKDQPYKLELIDGLERGIFGEDGELLDEKPVISLYTHDTFTDLCRGPHVENTREINPEAIKLMGVAGAYWRGDEHRPMLQRIYGTAWFTSEELDEHLWKLEEARKRDHRKLGRDLDLFSIEEDIGGGLVLWHPRGGIMRKVIEDFWNDQHEQSGYDFVYSPHIGRAQLWEMSGHLGFYKENMYAPIDIEGQQYYLKQ